MTYTKHRFLDELKKQIGVSSTTNDERLSDSLNQSEARVRDILNTKETTYLAYLQNKTLNDIIKKAIIIDTIGTFELGSDKSKWENYEEVFGKLMNQLLLATDISGDNDVDINDILAKIKKNADDILTKLNKVDNTAIVAGDNITVQKSTSGDKDTYTIASHSNRDSFWL